VCALCSGSYPWVLDGAGGLGRAIGPREGVLGQGPGTCPARLFRTPRTGRWVTASLRQKSRRGDGLGLRPPHVAGQRAGHSAPDAQIDQQ